MYYVYTKLAGDKTFKDSSIPSQLKVWIVASHSDMPINMRLYKRDEMLKALKSWVYPYQRPVLRHHNTHTDAIGRVVDATYIGAEEWEVKVKEITGKDIELPKDASGAILVKAYITDKEAIQKIVAGNYTTVSVGFFADKLICNICGKKKPPLFADPSDDEEYCQHITGEEYDGQIAYDVPIGIEYREISFVNVPADSYAGITKIEATSLDEAMKEIQVVVSEQNDSVNSQNETEFKDNDNTVNSREEGNSMDEIKKLQDELAAKDAELKQLKSDYENLKEKHDKLLKVLKTDLIDRIAGLKAILLGIEDAEKVEALKDEYKDLDVSALKVIEKEYRALVENSLAEELEEDECEECKEKDEAEVEEKAEEEKKKDAEKEENEDSKENEEEVKNDTDEDVNLQKEKNPAPVSDMKDPFDTLDEILIGKKK